MSVSVFDQLLNANKPFFFLEPMLELNKMALHFYGDAAKEQAKAMNELMRCHIEQFQQISHAKKWEEMMEIQANWAAKASSPMNEYMQNMINSCMDMTSNYVKWLEKSLQRGSISTESSLEKVQEKAISPHRSSSR